MHICTTIPYAHLHTSNAHVHHSNLCTASETQALTEPRRKCGQWSVTQRLQFESRERALETGDNYRRSPWLRSS